MLDVAISFVCVDIFFLVKKEKKSGLNFIAKLQLANGKLG